MSSTAINPRKRTATTTTTTTTDTVVTMMNGSSSTVAKNQLNVAAKRNKFENTPVISSLVQKTEYTVLDVQRLLHVMETTTPSESSSSSSSSTTTTNNNNNNNDDTTHSWKDYEIRAQLLQDMYTNVYNKTQSTVTSTATTNGSKKHKQQHQNSLQLLEELHPRIQTILQVTKDYIITLKEQQQRNNNTTDPFDKLFPPPVTSTIPTMKTTVAPTKTTSTKTTTTTTTPSVSSNSDSVTVTVPPPKVSHQKKTPATSSKNNSSTMVEIQQQQREQMEMAVSQMAEQLKLQTKSMNEQIQQQNNQMIDELHTTMEQNVQDVTKVTQLTQQQITNTSRRSYSKWTMIILMAITFVMTLLFILTIPKPRNHHPIYTKYIHEPSSNGVHKNTNTNNETTHICRLLPSGVEECYYIPETTNVVVKEESNDTPIIHDIQQQEQQEPQQNDVLDDHNVPDQQQQQQQHEVLPEEQNVHDPHQQNQVQEEETREHITTVGQEDNTVNTAAVTQDVVVNDNVVIDSNDNNNNMEQDMDQLYITLRHSAVNEVNIPVMKQYIQTHPSLLYYTDTNGWSLLHELARSSSSSSTTTSTNTLQDRIEMIQYIIEQNDTLIHLTTHLGLTPYDLAMNNINSMNHEQQEQYQTIVTLLHPPTPDLSETIPIDEGVTGSVESSGTDELDRTVSEEVPESLSPPDMIVDATIASTEEVEAEVPVVEAEIVMDQISDGANTQVEQDTEDETVVPEEEEETFVEGLSIFELAKHAIAFNEIDLFRTYVEEYPSLLYDVDEEDNGMSLLHFAVRYKNAYNIVQYLLETSLSAMENEEEDEEGYHIPIWTIATYGRVNEETGIVEVPPQTPYDLALELYAVKDPTDPEHPSLQLLREVVMTEHDEFFMEDEEVDEYNSGDDEMECNIDVTTGLCRQTDTIQQDTEVDGIDSLLQIPDDSGDILEDALRDFEEMKRG